MRRHDPKRSPRGGHRRGRKRSRKKVPPSPIAWEDQVFYFLLLDRFSDGRENDYWDNQRNVVTTGTTPMSCSDDRDGAAQSFEDTAR